MWRNPDNSICDNLPDYLNDLNAMHEAEKSLSKFQLQKYGEHLQEIVNYYCVGVVSDYPRDFMCLAMIAGATAAQRAEAFLKTLGLWEDDSYIPVAPNLGIGGEE